jgi:drug/metabolite transporter superfamily protein YnfA
MAKKTPATWWFRDHASVIAVVSVLLTIALGIFAGVQTYAANGGLQQRETLLEGQLADARDFNRAITSLVDDQLAKGTISLQAVLQYLPGWQRPADHTLVITSPARPSANQPAVVPNTIVVTGTINTELKGRKIWIVIETPGINRFYPQGSWPDRVGPAILAANHQWASPTVQVGARGSNGRIFYVIAVLADANASHIFWQYLKTGASTHSFPGLEPMPPGAVEYDRVEVVRS